MTGIEPALSAWEFELWPNRYPLHPSNIKKLADLLSVDIHGVPVFFAISGTLLARYWHDLPRCSIADLARITEHGHTALNGAIQC